MEKEKKEMHEDMIKCISKFKNKLEKEKLPYI